MYRPYMNEDQHRSAQKWSGPEGLRPKDAATALCRQVVRSVLSLRRTPCISIFGPVTRLVRNHKTGSGQTSRIQPPCAPSAGCRISIQLARTWLLLRRHAGATGVPHVGGRTVPMAPVPSQPALHGAPRYQFPSTCYASASHGIHHWPCAIGDDHRWIWP
jgi:hypothetical protein